MKLEPSKIARSSSDLVQLGCHLKITVAANQGGRKYMEDRVHIETIRDSDGAIKFTFLGVFDGHGGYEASEHVRRYLLANIMASELFESDDDEDVLEAIREGFLTTHEDMTKVVDTWPRTASGFPSTAGTTCSIALIRNGKLYTGHVGDSAIFLGSRANKNTNRLVTDRVTVDHKPESLEEQARIELAGGKVMMKSGISRVVWTRPMRGHTGPVRRNTPMEYIPFLAVARSLGDLWSYCEETKQYVVSPDPDVSVRTLTEDDACIVLVSDGVTNVLAPSQITKAVEDEELAISEKFFMKDAMEPDRQPNHARRILFDALKRWNTLRADNLSSIVVLLDHAYHEAEDYASSVDEVLKDNESIDEMLLMDPECMIHVTPARTQKLFTSRIPLLYEGTLDGNFCSVEYRGPGFMTHDEEEDIEARILLTKKATAELAARCPAASVGANVTITEEEEEDNDDDEDDEEEAELSAIVLSTPTPDLTDKTNNPPEERKTIKRELSPSKENMLVPTKKLHVESKEESDDDNSNKEELDNSDEEEPPTEGAQQSAVEEPVVSEPCTPTTSRAVVGSIKTRSAAKIHATGQITIDTPKLSGRKIAVAARRLSMAKNEININSPSSSISYSIVTRSRDRKALPSDCNSPAPLTDASSVPAVTPSRSALFMETGSRKRPSRMTPMQSAGVTPFMERIAIATPGSRRRNVYEDDDTPAVHSEPSTPVKECGNPMTASSWSLGKLLPEREEFHEPPSKIRRIYGFMRRLVGLSTPA